MPDIFDTAITIFSKSHLMCASLLHRAFLQDYNILITYSQAVQIIEDLKQLGIDYPSTYASRIKPINILN